MASSDDTALTVYLLDKEQLEAILHRITIGRQLRTDAIRLAAHIATLQAHYPVAGAALAVILTNPTSAKVQLPVEPIGYVAARPLNPPASAAAEVGMAGWAWRTEDEVRAAFARSPKWLRGGGWGVYGLVEVKEKGDSLSMPFGDGKGAFNG